MGQITGGMVRFARKVKPADYEGAEAVVELSFSAEDGEYDQILKKAGAVAKNQVLTMLGILKPETAVATGRTKADLEAEKAAELGAPVAASKPPAARKPPAAPKPAAVPAAPAADPKPNISTGEARVDPADAGIDMSDMLGTVPAVEEITDEVLVGHVSRKNAKLQPQLGAAAPAKIRELLAKYMLPGTARPQVIAVPQARRQEFLKDLEALTA